MGCSESDNNRTGRGRRWRFRYTLRGLALLILALSVLLAYVAFERHAIQRQRAALARIRKIQAEMTAKPDAWIDAPLEIEQVQLPWWLACGGERELEKVVGVSFTFGYFDEQLQPETKIGGTAIVPVGLDGGWAGSLGELPAVEETVPGQRRTDDGRTRRP